MCLTTTRERSKSPSIASRSPAALVEEAVTRVAILLWVTGILSGALATAAGAATVAVERQPSGALALVYRAEPGERNVIQLSHDGPSFRSYYSPESENLTTGAGCTKDEYSGFVCDGASVTEVILLLGDGDDNGHLYTTARLTLYGDGGPGDDSLNRSYFTGSGPTIFWGRDGDDVLSSSNGRDRLFGGDGNDLLDGHAGADLLSGGNGTDVVRYSEREESDLRVTLDGNGPDGFPEEDDTVPADVEGVHDALYEEASVLVGNPRANLLRGGSGDDRLVGRDGRDTLIGEGGYDWINARDGVADLVACGADVDTVYADRRDDLSAECERVRYRRPPRRR
jgi:Ca2+-binding RTX toxin-like protein